MIELSFLQVIFVSRNLYKQAFIETPLNSKHAKMHSLDICSCLDSIKPNDG